MKNEYQVFVPCWKCVNVFHYFPETGVRIAGKVLLSGLALTLTAAPEMLFAADILQVGAGQTVYLSGSYEAISAGDENIAIYALGPLNLATSQVSRNGIKLGANGTIDLKGGGSITTSSTPPDTIINKPLLGASAGIFAQGGYAHIRLINIAINTTYGNGINSNNDTLFLRAENGSITADNYGSAILAQQGNADIKLTGSTLSSKNGHNIVLQGGDSSLKLNQVNIITDEGRGISAEANNTQINLDQTEIQTQTGTGIVLGGEGSQMLATEVTINTQGQGDSAQNSTTSSAISLSNNSRLETLRSKLSTQGNYAKGLVVGSSSALLNSTSITTKGENAIALQALMTSSGIAGEIDIANKSNILTTKDNANAIVMHTAFGKVSMSNVSTQGNNSHAILLSSDFNATSLADRSLDIVTESRVSTEGDGAIGLMLEAGRSASLLSRSSIKTIGKLSHAVQVQGDNARFTLENATIETQGTGANGLQLIDTTTQQVAKSATISVSGDNAAAAKLSNSQLALTNSTLLSEAQSLAILANGNASLSFDGGNILAEGRAIELAKDSTLNLTIGQNRGGNNLYSNSGQLITSLDNSHLNLAVNQAVLKGDVNIANATANLVLDNTHWEGDLLSRGELSLQASNTFLGGSIDLANASATLNLEDSGWVGSLLSQGQLTLEAKGSEMVGNWQLSDTKAEAKLALSQQASLSGSITGQAQLTMSQGSRWQMTGPSSVGDLLLLNSRIDLIPPNASSRYTRNSDFKTLTINGNLSGNGTFGLNTNLASGESDLLQVRGQATGAYTLAIADSGIAPEDTNLAVQVVETQGGDANFALQGGKVSAGAYQYVLERQDNNWVLRGTPELSDGANDALGNQAAMVTLWSAQINSLVKRLGELRMGQDQGGMWARAVNKRFQISPDRSRDFEQNITGLEIGADRSWVLNNEAKIYLGAMTGIATAKQTFDTNDTGKTKSFLLGAYATYIHDKGFYVDGVLSYNRLKHEMNALSNLGYPINAQYRNAGYAVDVEVGQRFNLPKDWFIEPQLELTYTYTGAGNYVNSIGLEVNVDAASSLQGRLGVLFGKNLIVSNKAFQPYAKISYIDEFKGNTGVRISGEYLKNRLANARTELGVGGVLQLGKQTKMHLDAQYAKGHGITQPWALTLGVRHTW